MTTMEPPQPESLELRTSWNGDTAHPATIRVILQVQARPHSSLTILKNVDDVIGLTESDSFEWKTTYVRPKAQSSPPPVKHVQPNEEAQDSLENASARASASEIGRLLQSQEDDSTAQDLLSQDGESDGQTTIKGPNNDAASSSRSYATTTPRPSKIPIRKFDLDGASDDLDPSESMADPLPEKGRHADNTVHNDDFDFDLPPSPTASSQDLFPWTSTKDIASRIEQDPYPLTDKEEEAYIRRNDVGNLVFYVPSQGREGLYRAEVIFHQFLAPNVGGWYMLDLTDVIAACPNIPGKVVLDIPRGSAFEHKITGLDNVQESDGDFQSVFDPRDRPFVFFQIREREHQHENEANVGPDDIQHPENAKVYQVYPTDDKAAAAGDIQMVKLESDINSTEGTGEKWASSSSKRSPENKLRQQFISTLQWLLPTLFLSTMFIFTVIGGPPEAISTPSNTFRTVGDYANHLLARLEAHVNVSQQYPRGLYQYIIDQGLDTLPTIVSHDELLQLNESHNIDQDTSPEENGNNDSLDSDMCFLPWAGPIDYHGPVCPSMLSIDDKKTRTLSDDTASSTGEIRRIDRRNRSSGGAVSLGEALSSLAADLLRHVACSTSAACTMTRVTDYKDPKWEVFERYYCGENGSWRPTTIRDRVDHLLGWTPPECWED